MGYHKFCYEFNTIHEFINKINSSTINKTVFDPNKLASRKDNFSWSGTENYEEAVKLCQNGWSQDFQKLVHVKSLIDKKLITHETKQKQTLDIVGHTPSIPDWLQNNPMNMWNDSKKEPADIINISVNIAYPSFTNKEAIFNRGIILQSVVDALENKGYSVRLTTCASVKCCEEIIFANFRLKNEDEKLNIRKTYFPLCHPSFLRRLIFRLIETTPVREKNWTDGYGEPSSSGIIKKFLNLDPNDVVITHPSEVGIEGNDINTDLCNFLENTNLKKLLEKT